MFLVAISKECTWEVLQELYITNSVQNGEMAKDFRVSLTHSQQWKDSIVLKRL